MTVINQRIKEGDYNTRASVLTLTCTNCNKCSSYKKGRCSLNNHPSWYGPCWKCPYGSIQSATGYTQRAKKYYDWIKQQEVKHENITKGINKLFLTCDYIVFPYKYVEWSEIFDNGNNYMKFEDFTPEVMILILTHTHRYRTADLYREKELLCKHLKYELPEKFKEFDDLGIKVAELAKACSDNDRTAYLTTLKTGCKPFQNKDFTWDGEYLVSTSSDPLWLPGSLNKKELEDVYIKLKPKDDTTVKIWDEESQVTEETVFID